MRPELDIYFDVVAILMHRLNGCPQWAVIDSDLDCGLFKTRRNEFGRKGLLAVI